MNDIDRITVRPTSDWRDISPDLWGVFFEDISYSADGGLAAEMVRNGSFTFDRRDGLRWSGFTAWKKTIPAGSRGAFSLTERGALADENPMHAVVEVEKAPIVLTNEGFDGMRVRGGLGYRCSLWGVTRDAQAVRRGADGGTTAMRVRASLIDDDGGILAQDTMTFAGAADGTAGQWTQRSVMLHPDRDAANGRLSFEFLDAGTLEIDFVSLEPDEAWHGNPLLHHLRADLVDVLADLHPRFMRFPGGCIAHGYSLANMYHWKHTIGPVEHRRQQFNCWGYHQSYRLGYFEYLCLCEAIGAKPLPIVSAGVCCQNTDSGPVPIPQSEMGEYVQDVLDLIEFCNGDATTGWGAKRAELGHPEPFKLEMIGIGNEDRIDEVFENRFMQIYDAVRERYPQIKVVGTVGPALFGEDYDNGWEVARRLGVDIVDEHSYQAPAWWFQHLDHYDDMPRSGPKVYLGEYGSWGSTLLNALSEAALMTAMERNGDVVSMASYAPLFCKNGHASWNPNLIYFDNDRAYHTYSYWVQRMFAHSGANRALPVSTTGDVSFERPLTGPSVLRCLSKDGHRLSDIVVGDRDGELGRCAELVLADNDRWTDSGISWQADEYDIRCNVTVPDARSYCRVAFGDVDGKDHWSIGLRTEPSKITCAISVIRDGYGTSYVEPEPIDASVVGGQTIALAIHVGDGGRTVRVTVDGGHEIVSVEPVREIRRTVGIVHDDAKAMTLVRVVNATDRPMEADCSACSAYSAIFGGRALQSVRAFRTVLTGEPDAGVGGEEPPTVPVRERVDLSDARFECPAWSFTVVEIPDSGSDE
ncbi:alpha-L-arabinofuranosidase [Bifidobacterium hapali]|uniref:non-reducing end alpha-L-arabinofuranosidase n=1 Tax=Bifidobacterium hapali TaxID=1630172 RepID=A0A261FWM9_9BIFI|nr:alpha-L-arabinofuranosidase C-terminal domain-containing protein [Bifidobacterium hapali]OZG63552.1 alpha-L-arabinofuranosidase [Bifidobacterium hapali]